MGRKRLRDQLHQSVQTVDSSFSLSGYLQTSQRCWIRTRIRKKQEKKKKDTLKLNKDELDKVCLNKTRLSTVKLDYTDSASLR